MRLDRVRECQTCDFCEFTHFPEKNADGVRVFDEGSGATCPVCMVNLVWGSVSGSPVEHCLTCRGSLIEMASFATLVASLRAERRFAHSLPPANPKELERRIHCPRCGDPMDTHIFGGPGNIVIDNCSRCLLNFLDHNELNRIAIAPEPAPRPRMDSTPVELLGPKTGVREQLNDAKDPVRNFLSWLVKMS